VILETNQVPVIVISKGIAKKRKSNKENKANLGNSLAD